MWRNPPTEREARHCQKRRCSAQQVQVELRMCARYVNEERLTTDHPPISHFSLPTGLCLSPHVVCSSESGNHPILPRSLSESVARVKSAVHSHIYP